MMRIGIGRKLLTAVSATALLAAGSLATATSAEAKDVVVGRSATISYFNGTPPAGSPGLLRAEVAQNVNQSTVTAKVTFTAAQPAADNTDTQIYFGKQTNSSCNASFAMAMRPGSNSHHGAFLPSTTVTTTLTKSGSTATVTARGNARLGSTVWDCAYAISIQEGLAQQTSGWVELDEATVEIPELLIVTPATVAAKGKKWTKVQIKIQNTANQPVKNVVVKLAGKKLKFKKKQIKIASLGARKTLTRNVKARLKGKKTRTIKARVSGTGAIGDSMSTKVLRYKKSTKLKTLRGQYFWGADSDLDTAWQPRGVYFVNNKWAYIGIPAKGLPKKCSSKKKECQRYTYNARTGKVRVGKQTGTADSKGLQLKPKKGLAAFYSRLTIPKKGSKFKVALHHQGSSGCGYGYGKTCYTYTWYLTLGKNGKFSEARQSTTSGSIPNDWYVVGGNDTKGKYKILSRGRIELRYADGTKKVRTIGVFLDAREKAAPRTEGIAIAGTKYYD